MTTEVPLETQKPSTPLSCCGLVWLVWGEDQLTVAGHKVRHEGAEGPPVRWAPEESSRRPGAHCDRRSLGQEAGGYVLEAGEDAHGEGYDCSSLNRSKPSSFLSFYTILATVLPRMGLLHPELCWANLAEHFLADVM